MAHITPIHLILILAPFFVPTLTRSEPVTLGYWARVELIMLDLEKSTFECSNDDLPAQIEIGEDTFGTVYANFPTSLLNRSEQPGISVTRGLVRVPERVYRMPIRLRNDDWSMRIAGTIGFCIGPATLKVMQGSLDVFAQLGQYEGSILTSDNVLRDLNIEYDVNSSDMELAYFLHPKIDNFPSELSAQFIGSGSDSGNRILGRLDLDANHLAVSFAGPGDLDDVIHLTRLNVRLLVEEAISAAE